MEGRQEGSSVNFSSDAVLGREPPFDDRRFSWAADNHLKRQRDDGSPNEGRVRPKVRKSSSDDSSSPGPNSKKGIKTHVPSACANCKKAHLACDVSRPCKRCVAMGKTDTCIDIQHKKRGRPKIKDKKSDSFLHNSKYSQIIHLTPTTYDTQSEPHSTSMFQARHSIPSSKSVSTLQHSSSQLAEIYRDPSSHSSLPGNSTPLSSTLNMSSCHSHFQTLINPATSLPLQYNIYEPSKKVEVKFAQDSSNPRFSDESDFVMMLSFKMECAMISEEYHELLGYTSQDLVNRSVYDIVHATDIVRIRNLKDQLIDHIVRVISQYQGSFLSAPPRDGFGCSLSLSDIQKQAYIKLKSPASGTEYFTEAIHIRRKDGGYELFNVQMSVGGAFGTDVTSIDTYDKAYVICRLAKFQLPSLLLNNNNGHGSNTELPYLTH